MNYLDNFIVDNLTQFRYELIITHYVHMRDVYNVTKYDYDMWTRNQTCNEQFDPGPCASHI